MRTPESRFSLKLKAVSFTLAVLFTAQSTLSAAPAPSISAGSSIQIEILRDLQIPEELGRIEEKFFPSSDAPKGPVIIHIRDAHAQPEAQRNIEAILNLLAGNKKIQTVAAEAAFGEIDPDVLRLLPDEKSNRAMIEDLAQAGEINGVELFAFNNQYGTKLQGVEDAELYRKSLDIFRRVKQARNITSETLKDYRTALETQEAETLNSELKNYLIKKRAWEQSHDLSLDYFLLLRDLSKNRLDLDFTDPSLQFQWPQMVHLIKAAEIETGISQEKAVTETLKLAEAFGSSGADSYYSQGLRELVSKESKADFQIWLLQHPFSGVKTTRHFFEALWREARSRKISLLQYPAFLSLGGLLILRGEIDSRELFAETARLEKLIEEKIVQTENERKIAVLGNDLGMITRLLSLEMLREDYDNYVKRSDELTPAALQKRFKEFSRNQISLPLFPEPILNDAAEFYAFSVKRDEILIENTLKASAGNSTVLVAGGFHSQGLLEILKSRGIPYASIMPKMNSLSDENLYEKAMLGQNTLQFTAAGSSNLGIQFLMQPAQVYQNISGNPTQTARILRALLTSGIRALEAQGRSGMEIYKLVRGAVVNHPEIFGDAQIILREQVPVQLAAGKKSIDVLYLNVPALGIQNKALGLQGSQFVEVRPVVRFPDMDLKAEQGAAPRSEARTGKVIKERLAKMAAGEKIENLTPQQLLPLIEALKDARYYFVRPLIPYWENPSGGIEYYDAAADEWLTRKKYIERYPGETRAAIRMTFNQEKLAAISKLFPFAKIEEGFAVMNASEFSQTDLLEYIEGEVKDMPKGLNLKALYHIELDSQSGEYQLLETIQPRSESRLPVRYLFAFLAAAVLAGVSWFAIERIRVAQIEKKEVKKAAGPTRHFNVDLPEKFLPNYRDPATYSMDDFRELHRSVIEKIEKKKGMKFDVTSAPHLGDLADVYALFDPAPDWREGYSPEFKDGDLHWWLSEAQKEIQVNGLDANETAFRIHMKFFWRWQTREVIRHFGASAKDQGEVSSVADVAQANNSIAFAIEEYYPRATQNKALPDFMKVQKRSELRTMSRRDLLFLAGAGLAGIIDSNLAAQEKKDEKQPPVSDSPVMLVVDGKAEFSSALGKSSKSEGDIDFSQADGKLKFLTSQGRITLGLNKPDLKANPYLLVTGKFPKGANLNIQIKDDKSNQLVPPFVKKPYRNGINLVFPPTGEKEETLMVDLSPYLAVHGKNNPDLQKFIAERILILTPEGRSEITRIGFHSGNGLKPKKDQPAPAKPAFATLPMVLVEDLKYKYAQVEKWTTEGKIAFDAQKDNLEFKPATEFTGSATGTFMTAVSLDETPYLVFNVSQPPSITEPVEILVRFQTAVRADMLYSDRETGTRGVVLTLNPNKKEGNYAVDLSKYIVPGADKAAVHVLISVRSKKADQILGLFGIGLVKESDLPKGRSEVRTLDRRELLRLGAVGAAILGGVDLSAQPKKKEISVIPGVQGHGTTTPAGRGGAIIHVTTLNDKGPGSLRDAIAQKGPRTIVFDIAGTIELKSHLDIRDPFITIAGQTAPGQGITLKGAGLIIRSHDVLVQHLQIRVGDEKSDIPADERDAIQILGPKDKNAPKGVTGAENVVIDHVSMSWWIDDISVQFGAKNITFSNNIFAEALNDSVHPKGKHSKGLLISKDSENIALIGNLFASLYDRNPGFLKGNTKVLIANNLIYNGGRSRMVDIGAKDQPGPVLVSVAGNVFVRGPDSQKKVAAVGVSPDAVEGTQIYLFDNLLAGEGFTEFLNESTIDDKKILTEKPVVWPSDFKPRPAKEVEAWALKNAGSFFWMRSDVDKQIVEGVKTRKGKIIDTPGKFPQIKEVKRVFKEPAMPNRLNADGYTNLEKALHAAAQPRSEARVLSLKRQRGERIFIGNEIVITNLGLDARSGLTRVQVEASKDVPVQRTHLRISEMNQILKAGPAGTLPTLAHRETDFTVMELETGQSFTINGNIGVSLLEQEHQAARLGFTAPVDMPVYRQELLPKPVIVPGKFTQNHASVLGEQWLATGFEGNPERFIRFALSEKGRDETKPHKVFLTGSPEFTFLNPVARPVYRTNHGNWLEIPVLGREGYFIEVHNGQRELVATLEIKPPSDSDISKGFEFILHSEHEVEMASGPALALEIVSELAQRAGKEKKLGLAAVFQKVIEKLKQGKTVSAAREMENQALSLIRGFSSEVRTAYLDEVATAIDLLLLFPSARSETRAGFHQGVDELNMKTAYVFETAYRIDGVNGIGQTIARILSNKKEKSLFLSANALGLPADPEERTVHRNQLQWEAVTRQADVSFDVNLFNRVIEAIKVRDASREIDYYSIAMTDFSAMVDDREVSGKMLLITAHPKTVPASDAAKLKSPEPRVPVSARSEARTEQGGEGSSWKDMFNAWVEKKLKPFNGGATAVLLVIGGIILAGVLLAMQSSVFKKKQTPALEPVQPEVKQPQPQAGRSEVRNLGWKKLNQLLDVKLAALPSHLRVSGKSLKEYYDIKLENFDAETVNPDKFQVVIRLKRPAADDEEWNASWEAIYAMQAAIHFVGIVDNELDGDYENQIWTLSTPEDDDAFEKGVVKIIFKRRQYSTEDEWEKVPAGQKEALRELEREIQRLLGRDFSFAFTGFEGAELYQKILELFSGDNGILELLRALKADGDVTIPDALPDQSLSGVMHFASPNTIDAEFPLEKQPLTSIVFINHDEAGFEKVQTFGPPSYVPSGFPAWPLSGGKLVVNLHFANDIIRTNVEAAFARSETRVFEETEALVRAIEEGKNIADLIRPYMEKTPDIKPEELAAAEKEIAEVYELARSITAPEFLRTLNYGFALAIVLHADQPRASKGDSRPYMIHVAGVVRLLIEQFGLSDQITDPAELANSLAAAWLHDTIEDGKKGRWGKKRFKELSDNDAALRTEIAGMIKTAANPEVLNMVQSLSKPDYEGFALTSEVEIEARYYVDLTEKPLATQLIKAADFSFNLGDIKNSPDRKFPAKFFLKRLGPVLGFLSGAKINYAAKKKLVDFIRASVDENQLINANISDPVNAPDVLSPEQKNLLAAQEKNYSWLYEGEKEHLISGLKENARITPDRNMITGVHEIEVEQVLHKPERKAGPVENDARFFWPHAASALWTMLWLANNKNEFLKDRGDAALLTSLEDWLTGWKNILLRVISNEGERDNAPQFKKGILDAYLYLLNTPNEIRQQVDWFGDVLEVTNGIVSDPFEGSVSMGAFMAPNAALSLPDAAYFYRWLARVKVDFQVSDNLIGDVAVNVKRLSEASGKPAEKLKFALLIRPRHAAIIEELIKAGVDFPAELKEKLAAINAMPVNSTDAVKAKTDAKVKFFSDIEKDAKKKGHLTLGNIALVADGDMMPAFAAMTGELDAVIAAGGPNEVLLGGKVAKIFKGSFKGRLVPADALKEENKAANIATAKWTAEERNKLIEHNLFPEDVTADEKKVIFKEIAKNPYALNKNLTEAQRSVRYVWDQKEAVPGDDGVFYAATVKTNVDNPWVKSLKRMEFDPATGRAVVYQIRAGLSGDVRVFKITFNTVSADVRAEIAQPKDDSNLSLLHYRLGRALFRFRQYEDAFKAFDEAKRLANSQPEIERMEAAIAHHTGLRILVQEKDSPNEKALPYFVKASGPAHWDREGSAGSRTLAQLLMKFLAEKIEKDFKKKPEFGKLAQARAYWIHRGEIDGETREENNEHIAALDKVLAGMKITVPVSVQAGKMQPVRDRAEELTLLRALVPGSWVKLDTAASDTTVETYTIEIRQIGGVIMTRGGAYDAFDDAAEPSEEELVLSERDFLRVGGVSGNELVLIHGPERLQRPAVTAEELVGVPLSVSRAELRSELDDAEATRRKVVVGGNWKMAIHTQADANALITGIGQQLKGKDLKDVTIMVAPSVPHLAGVFQVHQGMDSALRKHIRIGAQDVSLYSTGAYTGDVSAASLADAGVSFIIVGHSERRHMRNEVNAVVNAKVQRALNDNFAVVVGLGESLAEKETTGSEQVLRKQFGETFAGVPADRMKNVILLYEPVWVIGTGKTAEASEMDKTMRFIRSLVLEKYDLKTAAQILILYGGSVKPENVNAFIGQPNIDGVLAGASSLDNQKFSEIVSVFADSRSEVRAEGASLQIAVGIMKVILARNLTAFDVETMRQAYTDEQAGLRLRLFSYDEAEAARSRNPAGTHAVSKALTLLVSNGYLDLDKASKTYSVNAKTSSLMAGRQPADVTDGLLFGAPLETAQLFEVFSAIAGHFNGRKNFKITAAEDRTSGRVNYYENSPSAEKRYSVIFKDGFLGINASSQSNFTEAGSSSAISAGLNRTNAESFDSSLNPASGRLDYEGPNPIRGAAVDSTGELVLIVDPVYLEVYGSDGDGFSPNLSRLPVKLAPSNNLEGLTILKNFSRSEVRRKSGDGTSGSPEKEQPDNEDLHFLAGQAASSYEASTNPEAVNYYDEDELSGFAAQYEKNDQAFRAGVKGLEDSGDKAELGKLLSLLAQGMENGERRYGEFGVTVYQEYETLVRESLESLSRSETRTVKHLMVHTAMIPFSKPILPADALRSAVPELKSAKVPALAVFMDTNQVTMELLFQGDFNSVPLRKGDLETKVGGSRAGHIQVRYVTEAKPYEINDAFLIRKAIVSLTISVIDLLENRGVNVPALLGRKPSAQQPVTPQELEKLLKNVYVELELEEKEWKYSFTRTGDDGMLQGAPTSETFQSEPIAEDYDARKRQSDLLLISKLEFFVKEGKDIRELLVLLYKDAEVNILRRQLVHLATQPESGLKAESVQGIIDTVLAGNLSLKGEELDIIAVQGSGASETFKKLGTVDRNIAEAYGLLHRTANGFLISPRGKFYIQRRSPLTARSVGKYTITGGHVVKGGTFKNTMVDEARQENGLEPEQYEMVTIGREGGYESPGSDTKNRERRALYALVLSAEGDAVLQARKEELKKVKASMTQKEFSKWLEAERAKGEGFGEVDLLKEVTLDELIAIAGGNTATVEEEFKNSSGKGTVKIPSKIELSPGLLLPLFKDEGAISELRAISEKVKAAAPRSEVRDAAAERAKVLKSLGLSIAPDNIFTNFQDEMRRGLAGEPSSLAMFPAFVRPPTGQEEGDFLALDLGGTNFRVLWVRLSKGGRVEIVRSWKDKIDLTVQNDGPSLFGFIADSIQRFIEKNPDLKRKQLKLGFTFSFPVKQTGLASGKVTKMTKEFPNKGIKGKDPVVLLRNALKSKGIENIDVNALVNDTVGTLMFGDLGLIVGTGMNKAVFIPEKLIPKMNSDSEDPMAVNMESGAFNKVGELSVPDLLTHLYFQYVEKGKVKEFERLAAEDFSELVKQAEKLRGSSDLSQVMEKMVSGKYLPVIFQMTILYLGYQGHLGDAFLTGGKIRSRLINLKGLTEADAGKYKTLDAETLGLIEKDDDRFSSLIRLLKGAGVDVGYVKDKAALQFLKNSAKAITQRSAVLIGSTTAAAFAYTDPQQKQLSKQYVVAATGSVVQLYPNYQQNVRQAWIDVLGQQSADKIKIQIASDGSGAGAAKISAVAARSESRLAPPAVVELEDFRKQDVEAVLVEQGREIASLIAVGTAVTERVFDVQDTALLKPELTAQFGWDGSAALDTLGVEFKQADVKKESAVPVVKTTQQGTPRTVVLRGDTGMTPEDLQAMNLSPGSRVIVIDEIGGSPMLWNRYSGLRLPGNVRIERRSVLDAFAYNEIKKIFAENPNSVPVLILPAGTSEELLSAHQNTASREGLVVASPKTENARRAMAWVIREHDKLRYQVPDGLSFRYHSDALSLASVEPGAENRFARVMLAAITSQRISTAA